MRQKNELLTTSYVASNEERYLTWKMKKIQLSINNRKQSRAFGASARPARA
jgi:hypothetical protein